MELMSFCVVHASSLLTQLSGAWYHAMHLHVTESFMQVLFLHILWPVEMASLWRQGPEIPPLYAFAVRHCVFSLSSLPTTTLNNLCSFSQFPGKMTELAPSSSVPAKMLHCPHRAHCHSPFTWFGWIGFGGVPVISMSA